MPPSIRQAVTWLALIFIVALVVLSIYGAFIGEKEAPKLFNSPAMIVFWCVVLVWLLVGPLLFRRLRSLGGLAMHVGPAVILIGAMWGSQTAHNLRERHLGPQGPRRGFLAIHEGQSLGDVMDELGRPVGSLPFAIRLNEFWVEYYDQAGPWLLGAQLPVDHTPHEGHEVQGGSETFWLEWRAGEVSDLPGVKGKVQVLEYLPNARPSYAEGAKPLLEITPATGEKVTIPAEVGQETKVGEPPMTIRITRKFSNLVVQGRAEGRQVVDAPGPPRNPALAVEVEEADGTKATRFIMPRVPMHGAAQPHMSYLLPESVGAVADPAGNLPAMKVQLIAPDGRKETRWLIPTEGSDQAVIPIEMVLGEAATQGAAPATAVLALVKPMGAPKDFKSNLTVIDEGREVRSKVIEVNDPLHHGGYHFYQHSYQGDELSIFHVVDDAGLNWVWAGLALLSAGTFWGLWIRPVAGWLRRRRAKA